MKQNANTLTQTKTHPAAAAAVRIRIFIREAIDAALEQEEHSYQAEAVKSHEGSGERNRLGKICD